MSRQDYSALLAESLQQLVKKSGGAENIAPEVREKLMAASKGKPTEAIVQQYLGAGAQKGFNPPPIPLEPPPKLVC